MRGSRHELMDVAHDALCEGRIGDALQIIQQAEELPSLIIPYASRTGTRRNLDALREAGWRLLLSATGVLRTEGFRYALDNGAWTAFQKGEIFDEEAFLKALDEFGPEADWVAVPDIINAPQGGRESLEYSLSWLTTVQRHSRRALLVVQDGITWEEIAPHLQKGGPIGIFVGGSTKFKEETMGTWAALARMKQVWCHVGRVNTARRIALCNSVGATSFDGTSASRYAKTLPLLDGARRQLALGLENK